MNESFRCVDKNTTLNEGGNPSPNLNIPLRGGLKGGSWGLRRGHLVPWEPHLTKEWRNSNG